MAGIKNNRRTLYTKMALREAFLSLSEKKELSKITVTEICQLADLNRGTFYQYYTDPLDLYHQIETELIEEILPLVKLGSSNNLNEWLARLILILKENQTLSILLLQNYSDNHFTNAIFGEVHGLAMKEFKERFQEDDERFLEYYFIYFVKGAIGIILEWLTKDNDLTAEEISNLLAKLLLQSN